MPRRVGNSTVRFSHFEQRHQRARADHRNLGFSASRSESPNRLIDSTSSTKRDAGHRHPPLAAEQEIVPDADQRAERGLGRRQADAKDESRLIQDRETSVSVPITSTGRQHLGRICPNTGCAAARSDHARGRDIVLPRSTRVEARTAGKLRRSG